MKLITINERAAAQALLAVVGPEKRQMVEELYVMLDNAERAGNDDGFAKGYEDGITDADIDEKAAYNDAFDAGYDYGREVSTSYEQPDMVDAMAYDHLLPYDHSYEFPTTAALPPMQEQRSAVNEPPFNTTY